MSLPLNPKVQGGRDAYLLGFLLRAGIHSKYAERNPKVMISAQGNRLAGEHLRDKLSITDLKLMAIE
ncbi:hypothetical protein J577_2901 [Acinetobacter sp. 263903-1]|jgi:hypothetical protein|uniref:Uncharacterized protein n=1 Tax=Acinetobacter radioresistens SK82 TaxID=596318 RepID=A0ABP2GJC1_ACIRA|nr:hypothetical protein ACIRA0001_0702 [Acinetobacter radioresistens SK82]EXB33738.1 hypothetical protein J546_1519 [Acinetobacter sp. 1461402]EXB71030.1 hypothetical protein J550_2301 [Acinetobacter sp. 230853]EXB81627.1 hypothetical protein J538_2649 [Acinetobacter sp. 272263]EXC32065.1 hypothetical protein J520_1846 [Acinetobacter sp. 869535]EXE15690.1 hypothetical protein J559_0372 [Acinetobacter sp. 983759]EXE59189.1 hypothetical protein J579_1075 [Acinetobacter sp. 1239920]KCX35769.1 h